MEEDLGNLAKKVAELERRVSFLEGEKKLPEKVLDDISGEDKNTKGLSIWGIIAGFIALIIFFNLLSSFLFSSRGFSGINVLLAAAFIGLLLFAVKQFTKTDKQVRKTAGQEPRAVDFKQEIAGKAEEKNDFEFDIAANWFAIIGIIAIVIAVVFFLKFAFDNRLIGPVGQVSIGIFFGIVLIFAGEFLRDKFHKYSQIISGGGVVVLYLSVWAAYGVFKLISVPTTLISQSFITLLSALLAIRYSAVNIAVLGVIGAFATPLLLGKGFDNQVILMSYIVILNLGVLSVAFFKNWRELNITTFAGTYIVVLFWISSFYKEEKFLLTFSFLTFIFLIFAMTLFIYDFFYKKEAEESDVILMLLNGFAYFGIGYFLITGTVYKDTIGFFAFGLSAFYFILGYLCYEKFRESSYLTLGFLGISIVFLTLAVPLQVKKNLITIAWAVEAGGLVLLAFLINSMKLRVAALAVYMLVLARLFAFDTLVDLSTFSLILNKRFLTFLIAAFSMGFASFLFAKCSKQLGEEEKPVLPALLITLNIVLVWSLSWEAISYYNKKIDNVRKQDVQALSGEVRVLGYRIAQVNQFTYPNISTQSAVLATGVVQVKINDMNADGTNPFTKYVSGATVRVTSPDGMKLYQTKFTDYTGTVTFNNLVPGNYGILAYKAGYKGVWKQNGDGVGPGCLRPGFQGSTSDATIANSQTAGNLAAWDGNVDIIPNITVLCRDLGLTLVAGQYNRENQNRYPSNYQQNNYRQTDYQPPKQLSDFARKEIKDLESVRDVTLSVIWLLYSIAVLAIGIAFKYKPIRLFSLGFLGLTIFKVFLYDSRNLQQGYRIIAFVILGTILLGISLVYQRYKEGIKSFLLK